MLKINKKELLNANWFYYFNTSSNKGMLRSHLHYVWMYAFSKGINLHSCNINRDMNLNETYEITGLSIEDKSTEIRLTIINGIIASSSMTSMYE